MGRHASIAFWILAWLNYIYSKLLYRIACQNEQVCAIFFSEFVINKLKEGSNQIKQWNNYCALDYSYIIMRNKNEIFTCSHFQLHAWVLFFRPSSDSFDGSPSPEADNAQMTADVEGLPPLLDLWFRRLSKSEVRITHPAPDRADPPWQTSHRKRVGFRCQRSVNGGMMSL
jgi:hypothetical protein